VPVDHFTPAILSPAQLRFLITDTDFENSLSKTLKRVKDIFVFGCTVALRYCDLMHLKKTNIQYAPDGVNIVLHTQKTGAEVRIPLPDYALNIVNKYSKSAKPYVLPRLASSNFNKHIKTLIKQAGWDYNLPKIRHRRGKPVEIKSTEGGSCKFYDHISAHTMRRTAITTLLLMGVDENFVRRISGHKPGSTEFYRYVVIVQDYLNAKIKEAHKKLIEDSDIK
jgi:integrase